MRFLGLALVLAGSSLLGGLAIAQTYNSPRQYYGGWNKFPRKQGYYYRSYYYKPTPSYTGYKHHYVVYNRATPKYYYFYNTYTKRYWGRCPTYSDGQPTYDILSPEHRKPELDQIREENFKKNKDGMPSVPESKDGV